MIRNKFSFYGSYLAAIDTLPDKEQLILYKAITHYAFYGEEPQLTGVAKTCFLLIKPNIDSEAHRSAINTQNGRLGGRPESSNSKTEAKTDGFLDKKPIGFETKNPSVSESKSAGLEDAKATVSKEREKDKEKEIEKDILERDTVSVFAPVDWQAVKKAWKEKFPSRGSSLPREINRPVNFSIKKLLIKVDESDFLSSCNNLDLCWCVKHYDDIMADKYKQFERASSERTKLETGVAIHQRKVDEAAFEKSITDSFDEQCRKMGIE